MKVIKRCPTCSINVKTTYKDLKEFMELNEDRVEKIEVTLKSCENCSRI